MFEFIYNLSNPNVVPVLFIELNYVSSFSKASEGDIGFEPNGYKSMLCT